MFQQAGNYKIACVLAENGIVKENMEKLRKSFEEVAKQDTSGSVVQNSQKVYAGLTYGKGTLNEVFMDNEAARGFKA